MKRNIFLSGILALSLWTLGLSLQNADVSGDWEFSMQTGRGDFTQTIHFDQDGESLTVTMEGRGGREFTLRYTGVVQGDSMSGTVEMGQRGSIEWTATKK